MAATIHSNVCPVPSPTSSSVPARPRRHRALSLVRQCANRDRSPTRYAAGSRAWPACAARPAIPPRLDRTRPTPTDEFRLNGAAAGCRPGCRTGRSDYYRFGRRVWLDTLDDPMPARSDAALRAAAVRRTTRTAGAARRVRSRRPPASRRLPALSRGLPGRPARLLNVGTSGARQIGGDQPRSTCCATLVVELCHKRGRRRYGSDRRFRRRVPTRVSLDRIARPLRTRATVLGCVDMFGGTAAPQAVAPPRLHTLRRADHRAPIQSDMQASRAANATDALAGFGLSVASPDHRRPRPSAAHQ